MMTQEYLDRNDPIHKAERSKKREEEKTFPENKLDPIHLAQKTESLPVPGRVNRDQATKSTRIPIPSALKHQIVLRDQTQCTHRDLATQKRCFRRRWLDIHHVVPVSEGGKNELSNLTTLCSTHHRMKHLL